MSNEPLVSIIIPVYNGANYVREAIESALAQTYKSIEIIVVNDGSTDDGETERIALSYCDKIRYINKENGGVSSALNVGIKNMKGEYFSWLSHDDKYIPDKIEKQVRIVTGFEEDNVIAVCLDRQIDKNSNNLGDAPIKAFFNAGERVSMEEQLMFLLNNKPFSGCSLLIPKKIFDVVGGFDEGLRYNQDFDMWLKISLSGFHWVYSNDIGVLSRVHAAQVTQTRKDLRKHDSRVLGIRIIPHLKSISTKETNFLYYYTLLAARHNNKENLQDCLQAAKERKLFSWKQKCKIRLTNLYGRIRPSLRKIYYRLFKKVKTN